MDDFLQHPKTIIAALVLIGVSSIANLKLGTDPDIIRPDAYTGAMARDRAIQVDRRLAECDRFIENDRDWREAHIEWGRAASIKQSAVNERHKAQIEELYRRLP